MKRRHVEYALILVSLIMIGGYFGLLLINKRIADDTYRHALVADDADNEVQAMALFKEACQGGSKKACDALHAE